MSPTHILIVEDEEDILELIRYNLAKEHYEVSGVASGEEGLKAVFIKQPDLVLLDLMLPGMDGLEFCRALKKEAGTRTIPVIMVTAKGEESDIIKGLEMGADDYITKPFSPKVLNARVKAILRRRREHVPEDRDIVEIDALHIHPGRHEVQLHGDLVKLTLTEFKILHFLARRPGWVFTRYQIVDAVKGEDYLVTDRAIDVTIVGLRKKLGDCAPLIETVRGVGYRFKEN